MTTFRVDIELGGDLDDVIQSQAEDSPTGPRRVVERWVRDGILGNLTEGDEAFVKITCVRSGS